MTSMLATRKRSCDDFVSSSSAVTLIVLGRRAPGLKPESLSTGSQSGRRCQRRRLYFTFGDEHYPAMVVPHLPATPRGYVGAPQADRLPSRASRPSTTPSTVWKTTGAPPLSNWVVRVRPPVVRGLRHTADDEINRLPDRSSPLPPECEWHLLQKRRASAWDCL